MADDDPPKQPTMPWGVASLQPSSMSKISSKKLKVRNPVSLRPSFLYFLPCSTAPSWVPGPGERGGDVGSVPFTAGWAWRCAAQGLGVNDATDASRLCSVPVTKSGWSGWSGRPWGGSRLVIEVATLASEGDRCCRRLVSLVVAVILIAVVGAVGYSAVQHDARPRPPSLRPLTPRHLHRRCPHAPGSLLWLLCDGAGVHRWSDEHNEEEEPPSAEEGGRRAEEAGAFPRHARYHPPHPTSTRLPPPRARARTAPRSSAR